jgi:AmiR/NasT family two-component response regulator
MYTAYGNLCNAYLVKPIDAARLLAELRKLGLMGEAGGRM